MTALLLQRLRVEYTQPAGAPWRPQLASKPSRGFSTARCIKTIPHKTRGCAGFQPENKTSKCWSLTSSVNKQTNIHTYIQTFFFSGHPISCAYHVCTICVCWRELETRFARIIFLCFVGTYLQCAVSNSLCAEPPPHGVYGPDCHLKNHDSVHGGRFLRLSLCAPSPWDTPTIWSLVWSVVADYVH